MYVNYHKERVKIRTKLLIAYPEDKELLNRFDRLLEQAGEIGGLEVIDRVLEKITEKNKKR